MGPHAIQGCSTIIATNDHELRCSIFEVKSFLVLSTCSWSPTTSDPGPSMAIFVAVDVPPL